MLEKRLGVMMESFLSILQHEQNCLTSEMLTYSSLVCHSESEIRELWKLAVSAFSAAMSSDNMPSSALIDSGRRFGENLRQSKQLPALKLTSFIELIKLIRRSMVTAAAANAETVAQKSSWSEAIQEFFDGVEIGACSAEEAKPVDSLFLESAAEGKYKAIIEQLQDPVIILDIHDRLDKMNHSAILLFGESPERPLATLAPVLNSFRMTGKAEALYVQEDSSTGCLRRFSVRLHDIVSPAGDRIATCLLFHDVTDLQQAEEDLLLFKDLIDRTNDALFILNPDDGSIVYANQKACENLGYSLDQLLQLTVRDYAANAPRIEDWHRLVQYTRERGFALFETDQVRNDGSRFPVEISARLITTIDGKSYMVSLARDITERKKAEEALIEEKNKIEAIIAAIGDGITLQDRDFKVLYQSSVHLEKQGNHVGEYCYKAYQHRDSVCDGCLLQRTFEDGQLHHRETSAVTASGIIHLEVWASPIFDAHGKIIAGIEVARDITARKQMEEELSKAQKLESLGILAGGIAHDFNNLLTSILGSITLLLQDFHPNDKAFDLLAEAEKGCLRARELTRQLLTFSRGGAPVKKNASIRELIEQTATFAVRGSRSRCVFKFPDGLWRVEADAGQISQVMNNLVINAVQAMPNGGTINIEAANQASGPGKISTLEPGRYVRISVKDEGIGIPPADQKRIFDPYFTTKPNGTGLGLATSYSIIKKHGGIMAVESTPSKGTTFHFYLPAAEMTDEGKMDSEPSFSPLMGKILIMDDDEAVRLIGERMLKRMGFTVETSCDGTEALLKYQEAQEKGEPFSAVIMDLTIPGRMGGKEAVRRLLSIDPKAKAFVASGYSEDPVMSDCIKYGFIGVIKKPFLYHEMAHELAKLVPVE